MSDCDFNNPQMTCPYCGFVARSSGWKKNCEAQKSSVVGAGELLVRKFRSFGARACGKCLGVANEMDRNGPQWCRENIAYIVDRIKQNAKRLSWGEWFTATGKAALAGYTSIEQIVLEAIEMSESPAS